MFLSNRRTLMTILRSEKLFEGFYNSQYIRTIVAVFVIVIIGIFFSLAYFEQLPEDSLEFLLSLFVVFIIVPIEILRRIERMRREGVLVRVAWKLGLKKTAVNFDQFFLPSSLSLKTTSVLASVKSEKFSKKNILPLFLNSYLITQGHSRTIKHYFEGIYHSLPICLFEVSFTHGYGKYSRTYNFFTTLIKLPKKLPPVIIISRNIPSNEYSLPPSFIRVDTESNEFNKTYNVYAKEHNVHVFEVLAPDDMMFLLTHSHLRPIIETSEEQVYGMLHDLPINEKEFIDFLDFTEKLSKKIYSIIPALREVTSKIYLRIFGPSGVSSRRKPMRSI